MIGEVDLGQRGATVFTSLTLMLYLLVPWTATNLVDFFFVRRGHYAITDLFRADGIYGAWALARPDRLRESASRPRSRSWCCPTSAAGRYTGPLAKALNGVDIAWLVGLIVSGGVYWPLCARST